MGDEGCVAVESGAVRLKPSTMARHEIGGEGTFQCDHVFDEDATQEQVFFTAVENICEAVMKGYNCAVIAYGQTGSGKTHTIVGDARGRAQGVVPRAVATIFDALSKRARWSVEVSVLEIYNERVRDLLAPGAGTVVEVHEKKADGDSGGQSFWCPEAVQRPAQTPEDALTALFDGMRRRETARTDMNHSSSRSHLVFSLSVCQSDPEIGATLRSRFHLVDLAGSERLKRSMSFEGSYSARARSPSGGQGKAPQELRKEACEINKSLSQLALVIQRLTTPSSAQYIPYRDSMLTRLLAESFGGSSKTCLIITCSTANENREETRCSLDFGKRAKLVRNKAEINLEVANEPSAVIQAFITKQNALLQLEKDAVQVERDSLQTQRDALLAEKATSDQELAETYRDKGQLAVELERMEGEKASLQALYDDTSVEAAKVKDEWSRDIAGLREEVLGLQRRLDDAAAASCEQALQHEREMADLRQRCEGALADQKQRHEAELAESRQMCEVESRENGALLERNANTIASLLEERSALQRVNGEAAADVLRLQRERADAVSTFEEQSAEVYAKWQEDAAGFEAAKASLAAELEVEKAAVQERLEQALAEALALQEEKASVATSAREEKVALISRWQEDALKLREEKAQLMAAFEVEKLDLHARCQADVTRLQDERASSASTAEKERAVLSRKWQDALEDVRRLQCENAALEARRDDDRAAAVGALEAEKASAQRQCQDKVTRLLEDRASETSRLEMERVELHRARDEEVVRLEREVATSTARLEAEKAAKQQSRRESAAEATRLVQEKAALLLRLEGDAKVAQQRCQVDFQEHLVRIRGERVAEATQASSALAAVESRRRRSEANTSRFEDELRALRRELRTSASEGAQQEVSPECSGNHVAAMKNELLRRSLETARGDAQVQLLRRSRPDAESLPQPTWAKKASEASDTTLHTHSSSVAELETEADRSASEPEMELACEGHLQRGESADLTSQVLERNAVDLGYEMGGSKQLFLDLSQ